ncbi:hypothetical protein HRbin15_02700 [bacterium HR15]|nr:hypothetical protein HRbin15_02700 [bacterium HR15]
MATTSRTQSQTERKPRRWLGLWIGAGLAWLLLIGYAERHLEGNRLWLIGATYDAGVVPAKSVMTHRVWVINPTLQTLTVKPIPHCGCTVVEDLPPQLPPLWIAPLTLQVDTMGKPVGRGVQVVELVVQDGQYSWRERIEVRYELIPASQSR